MDVLIFSGQSNMQGSAGENDNGLPVKNCLEYRLLSDSLIPLQNPTGEDIGDSLYATRSASMLPFFCREYVKNTGKGVVAIHAARGATRLCEWIKGTKRYDDLILKTKKGIEKAETLGKTDKIYFIWLQGESDANEFVKTEDYLETLIAFKNDLMRDLPIDKFAIIRQGYFAAYASWVKGSFRVKRAADRAIMRAFDLAAKTDGDFLLLTKIAAKLSDDGNYLDPNGCGPHFNVAGLKLIAEKSAKKLSSIRNKT